MYTHIFSSVVKRVLPWADLPLRQPLQQPRRVHSKSPCEREDVVAAAHAKLKEALA
jgi:hypothetical protein